MVLAQGLELARGPVEMVAGLVVVAHQPADVAQVHQGARGVVGVGDGGEPVAGLFEQVGGGQVVLQAGAGAAQQQRGQAHAAGVAGLLADEQCGFQR